jgi:hypothetical protein
MSDAVPAHGEGRELQELMSFFDAPAYVRRARRVEATLAELLDRCRRQRHEWLQIVRIHLGRLAALAGAWETLRPYVADDAQLQVLRDLHDELQPRLRAPVEPTTSGHALRAALRELVESLQRFNGRWEPYLAEVDLGPVNAVRDGYNRYYLLEKECALRFAPGARRGFRPLEPFTRDELVALLPPLPIPRLA